MQARRLLGAALTVGAALVVAAGAAPARDRSAAAVPRELLYVANANSGPVTVYPADSHGTVRPVRTVLAPNDPNAVWDPWTVTFDRYGHLYVQTFLSDATAFVFRRNARGTATPLRRFSGIGPDVRGIAVDSHGYEYQVGGDSGSFLVVEAPGAAGKPANAYGVPALRTITLDESWNPWASDLAVDTQNDVLAVTARPQGNAVEVYQGGAHGGLTPLRVISGPHTGLGSCGAICDLVIGFSRFTGRIYVGVTDGASTRILVFAGNARGNARPVRTITGPATGLAGKAITGIADSQCDGTIYAMVHDSGTDFTDARIDVYGRLARGAARPLRSFTDSRSRFHDAEGLAITACPAP